MVNHKIREVVPRLLEHHFSPQFLNNYIDTVIGYGSGVFPQTAKQTNNTIDLLLVAKNSNAAHQYLLHSPECRKDYTGLSRLLGLQYLNLLSNYVFPVHFNHPIVQGTKIKYGIVDRSVFEQDLTTWRWLSLAGRLHKPVWADVMGYGNSTIGPLMLKNHQMALAVTLLRLISKINNQEIPLQTLFEQITHLSYLGDIRHSLSIENQNKTQNIVRHNYSLFHQIYFPLLERLANNLSGGKKAIDLSRDSIYIHYTPEIVMKLTHPQSLPLPITNHLSYIFNEPNKSLGQQILMNGAGEMSRQITKCISSINKKSSMKMAVQNFMGASLIDNVQYIMAKINKKNLK